jgi:hypothetical protein
MTTGARRGLQALLSTGAGVSLKLLSSHCISTAVPTTCMWHISAATEITQSRGRTNKRAWSSC